MSPRRGAEATPRTLRIVLPLPPNRANARGHWAATARKQRDYRIRCTAAHHRRPAEPLAPVILSAHAYVWNLYDEDGLTALLKWPIDWLVERQIILDDHPSAMTLGDVSQTIDRKDRRLVIDLAEFQR